jgi:hypothetical protein
MLRCGQVGLEQEHFVSVPSQANAVA